MGTGFEVAPAEVATAAGCAHHAVDAVRPVDLAGALAGVGLPGGASIAAVGRLAEIWREAVPKWASDTEAYGGQLDDAVRGYRGAEQKAVHDVATAAR